MFRKLLASLAELGIVCTFLYYVDQIFERVFSRRLVYFYDIFSQPVPSSPKRTNKSTDVSVIETEEAWRESELVIAPNESLALERLSRGCVCIAIHQLKELHAYGWISLNDYREDEVRCTFLPEPISKTGWDFDIFIAPEKRGSFTFVYLWDAINAYYRAAGRATSLSRISRFNQQSVRSHLRMGAAKIAWIAFIDFGILQLAVSDQSPKVSISGRRSRGPSYRFHA